MVPPFAARMKSRQTAQTPTAAQFVDVQAGLETHERPTTLREADILLAAADKTIASLQQRIEQLENLALTDELTGLTNRRGLMQALHRELAVAEREPHYAGLLILCDLNGFKRINDTHGHTAGDAYLQAVAEALLTEVRPSDLVARLGGDEFALLLPRIDHEQGSARLERIDHSFHTRSLTWKGRVLPLCASFGASPFGRGTLADELLASADLRLYAQKNQRR